jgi:hypothetical protein
MSALFSASSFSPARLSERTGAAGSWEGVWDSRLTAPAAIVMPFAISTRVATAARKTSSLRFIRAFTTAPRSTGPRGRATDRCCLRWRPRSGVCSTNRGRGLAQWLGLRGAGQLPRPRVRDGMMPHPRAPMNSSQREQPARLRQGCGEVAPKRPKLRRGREGGNAVDRSRNLIHELRPRSSAQCRVSACAGGRVGNGSGSDYLSVPTTHPRLR